MAWLLSLVKLGHEHMEICLIILSMCVKSSTVNGKEKNSRPPKYCKSFDKSIVFPKFPYTPKSRKPARDLCPTERTSAGHVTLSWIFSTCKVGITVFFMRTLHRLNGFHR